LINVLNQVFYTNADQVALITATASSNITTRGWPPGFNGLFRYLRAEKKAN